MKMTLSISTMLVTGLMLVFAAPGGRTAAVWEKTNQPLPAWVEDSLRLSIKTGPLGTQADFQATMPDPCHRLTFGTLAQEGTSVVIETGLA